MDKTLLPSYGQIRLFFLFISLESILNLAVLLIIPRELDNSFIFGYSAPRFAIIFFDFLISAFLIAGTINLWLSTSVGGKITNFIQNWLQDGFHVRVLQGVILLGIAIGTFFLVELVFTDNRFLYGILFRLSPTIGFGTIAFIQLNYLIAKIAKEQGLSIKFTNQVYYLALIWIILNLIWFLGTIWSLNGILILKRVVILSVSIFIVLLFSLDYALTSDSLSRWLLASSLILITLLSLWITNRVNEISVYTILTLMLFLTFVTQLIFLGIIMLRDNVKQNLTIANSIINIKSITILLTGIATILVSLALFLQMSVEMGFGELFNIFGNTFTLDSEMNVPSLFSSVILLIAAGLLFLVFTTQKKIRAPFTMQWIFLSVVFVFLSYDEMFSFHERFIGPLRKILVIRGVFSYEWTILAIPLVIIFAIAYARFLLHLHPNLRILMMLGGFIFLWGSIGGEMMSGWYASYFVEGDANYILLTIFEETLEMAGIIIFIHAVLLFLYELDSSQNTTISRARDAS